MSDDDNMGLSAVIVMAEGIDAGLDPMPVCLGETLIGLDLAKGNPKRKLVGSPLLLQVSRNSICNYFFLLFNLRTVWRQVLASDAWVQAPGAPGSS